MYDISSEVTLLLEENLGYAFPVKSTFLSQVSAHLCIIAVQSHVSESEPQPLLEHTLPPQRSDAILFLRSSFISAIKS